LVRGRNADGVAEDHLDDLEAKGGWSGGIVEELGETVKGFRAEVVDLVAAGIGVFERSLVNG
jgi:hypothetical protein